MAHDHRYVRELLRLREAPQLPVLWLLVPWLAATAWSCVGPWPLKPLAPIFVSLCMVAAVIEQAVARRRSRARAARLAAIG